MGDKLENLVEGLRYYDEIELGYEYLVKLMQSDYSQPKFYQYLFGKWGLDVPE